VQDWLAAADIYVLCSQTEGLSNTLLEAMATGLPCVVTAVSGTRELVAEPGCGLVVPVGNIRALATALIGLMSSEKLRHEMGARSRVVIVERLAIENVAQRHEALYQTLIQGTPYMKPTSTAV